MPNQNLRFFLDHEYFLKCCLLKITIHASILQLHSLLSAGIDEVCLPGLIWRSSSIWLSIRPPRPIRRIDFDECAVHIHVWARRGREWESDFFYTARGPALGQSRQSATRLCPGVAYTCTFQAIRKPLKSLPNLFLRCCSIMEGAFRENPRSQWQQHNSACEPRRLHIRNFWPVRPRARHVIFVRLFLFPLN